MAAIGLIFGLSSIPSLAGPDLGFQNVDKLYHCLEYGTVSFLVSRGFAAYCCQRFVVRNLTLITMPIIASLDEFYQGYVPGRFSDITDVAADCVGAAIGLFFFLWWWRQRLKQLAE